MPCWLNWDSQLGKKLSLPSQRNFPFSFKPKVAIAKFIGKRLSVKDCFISNHAFIFISSSRIESKALYGSTIKYSFGLNCCWWDQKTLFYKSGIISESIFNLVSSSKNEPNHCTISNLNSGLKSWRDIDFFEDVTKMKIPFEMASSLTTYKFLSVSKCPSAIFQ